MKNKIVFLAVLSAVIIFIAACAVEKEQSQQVKQAQQAEAAEKQEKAGHAIVIDRTGSDDFGTEPVARSEPESKETETYTTISPSNPLRRAESVQKGISGIEYNEPREYLDITNMKFRRTSRDKAELKELTLTFRNIGYEPVKGVVIMTFEDVYIKDQRTTVEKEFELPEIEPKMKFVKVFPVGVYYHYLEKPKDVTVSFYKKYETPKRYEGKKTLSIIPMDMLTSTEMKWV